MGLFGNSILMVSELKQINTIAAFENHAFILTFTPLSKFSRGEQFNSIFLASNSIQWSNVLVAADAAGTGDGPFSSSRKEFESNDIFLNFLKFSNLNNSDRSAKSF